MVKPHNEGTAPHNERTAPHNEGTATHKETTTQHNRKTPARNEITSTHNDKTTTHNEGTTSHNDQTSSHNDKSGNHMKNLQNIMPKLHHVTEYGRYNMTGLHHIMTKRQNVMINDHIRQLWLSIDITYYTETSQNISCKLQFFPLETNKPFSVDETLLKTQYSLSILDKSQLHVTDLMSKTPKL